MTICTDAFWPILLGEEGGMVVEEESEMVGNEIFTGYTSIEGVPILKRMAKTFERGSGDGSLQNRFSEKDIIPDFVNHVFGGYIGGPKCGSFDVRVEEVCNGVIGHINCRIRERFDDILGIPRKPGTKTVRSSASPLIEPVKCMLEIMSRLNTVCVQSRKKPNIRTLPL